VDIFDKLNIDQSPLGHYAHVDPGYFMFPKLEGEIGPRMTFRGTKVLNWSLNNYLGLANHPEVRKVDAEAAKNGEWLIQWVQGSCPEIQSIMSSLKTNWRNSYAEGIGPVIELWLSGDHVNH
jgi:hypothetical protein